MNYESRKKIFLQDFEYNDYSYAYAFGYLSSAVENEEYELAKKIIKWVTESMDKRNRG